MSRDSIDQTVYDEGVKNIITPHYTRKSGVCVHLSYLTGYSFLK